MFSHVGEGNVELYSVLDILKIGDTVFLSLYSVFRRGTFRSVRK